jgi:tetratricopeptide (TPR) repeat protein
MSRLRWAAAVLSFTMAAAMPAGAEPGASGDARKLAVEGDRAALARDFELAIARYRSILADDPRNALVHYRVGQVQAMKGDLNEAEQAYFAALRFAGTDDALRGRVLFCIADLRERQKAYEAAVDAWSEYEKQGVKAPSATPHVATAAERKNRYAEWKKAAASAAETRARQARRAHELDAAARENAK